MVIATLRIIPSENPAVPGLLAPLRFDLAAVETEVRPILNNVRHRGDQAVWEYTRRFDAAEIDLHNFRVSPDEIAAAYKEVNIDFLAGLKQALGNIRSFQEKLLPRTWFEPDRHGNWLGQLCRPLQRAGIYVPGGQAIYPSSVLMNAVPARVAGVEEIVMATPPRQDGTIAPEVLVAAAEAGVTEIWRMGGAQAIAALAYGTQSVRRVDKIAGPGNIYVMVAKLLVYGEVGIDLPAGPSEVAIVADGAARPAWLAADLLAQAEHDVRARAFLFTPYRELALAVNRELERLAADLPRWKIAVASLAERGAAIITTSLEESLELANKLAPEHLELAVREPFQLLPFVRNAGAVFLGYHSPVALGDYFAGPNHVLPTGGAARFASPLSVEDFLKRVSVISYQPLGLLQAEDAVATLAGAEGLPAHALSIRLRCRSEA